MIRYLAPRLVRAGLTVLLVVTVAFVGLRLSGDPALTILGVDAPPEAVAAFRAARGLDAPLWQQYLRYGAAVARGDLGLSMRDGRPAAALVAERVPATLALMLPALALKLALGLSAGLAAALYRGRLIDRAVTALAVLGFAVPSFVLGLVLSLAFAVRLHWLPSGGQGTWRHAVLPVLTLGLGGAAALARVARGAIVDVLGQPYIRAARARGLPWGRVLRSHALPNAAIPLVTLGGVLVGSLMAGSVVVESVFSWPGLGRLLAVAVASRDLAVVQCILLLTATALVTTNLIVDLLQGLLDPRLRAGRPVR